MTTDGERREAARRLRSMTLDELRRFLEAERPRSIERAHKALRKRGVPVDETGRIGVAEGLAVIRPDPLATVGLVVIPVGGWERMSNGNR